MKTNTLIDRRSFVKMAGAAWAAALSPRGAFALERADAVFASAFMAPDGSYGSRRSRKRARSWSGGCCRRVRTA